jgi:hypothetical protein
MKSSLNFSENYQNWRKKIPKDYHRVPKVDRDDPEIPTFEEFVRFLLRTRLKDAHVMGYQDKCDVCNLPYTFIGKVEKMERDDRFVVEQIGIGDKLKELVSQRYYVM